MVKNVGSADKILRILAGIILLALTLTGIIGYWGWVGIIPLLTGLAGFCPLYRLLGISSCRIRN